MKETSKIVSPKPDGVSDAKANRLRKISWFLRISGVLVLLMSMPRILHEGWPHSLSTCGSLAGFFQATMLFVMSFLFVATGRTKITVAAATIVLGVWVIVFSVAMLVLPHL